MIALSEIAGPVVESAKAVGAVAFAVGILAQIVLQVRAAKKVEEVKESLAITDGRTNTKLNDIHTLVNNSTALQLHTNMVLARRVSELTGKPEDAEIAATAEKAYQNHMRRQAVVDAQVAKDAHNATVKP